MHPILARTLHAAGSRLRNPSLASEARRLAETEWLSREELLRIQRERARQFLTFAGLHSPFYRAAFRDAGFEPARLESVSDLADLPVMDKAGLITHNDRIHTQWRFRRLFLAETSGTSGAALAFHRDERWDSINRAHQARGYRYHGVTPWERNGYLWGYDIAPNRARRVRLLDALQNRFRLFSYSQEDIRRFALRLRGAVYLGGYSSMIYEIARTINALDLPRPSLRLVKGTSEMILPAYQAEVERAFGRPMASEYGAAEAGLIAFECASGRMHVNVEDVILEVDADGEVLVTNLASYSFPVIRYRLGDVVRLSAEACPCGRAHPVLAEVLGRRGAVIQGRRGRYPGLTLYYVFKNLAVGAGVLLNYRAWQEVAGLLVVEVEGQDARVHEAAVRHELQKYLGDDMDVELRFVPRLSRGRGKPQYFESRLAG